MSKPTFASRRLRSRAGVRPVPDTDGPWTVLYRRPVKRATWEHVATVATFREAVALLAGAGDWWLTNRTDEAEVGGPAARQHSLPGL